MFQDVIFVRQQRLSLRHTGYDSFDRMALGVSPGYEDPLAVDEGIPVCLIAGKYVESMVNQ
ncbi:hypothetical protein NXW89_03705 [Bacteroides thetaiotaomicron]|nr:hypothetical protein [Bacteroides thetaiotaomicron]